MQKQLIMWDRLMHLRAQSFFDLLRLYGQKYTGGNDGIVLPLKFDPLNKQRKIKYC